MAGPERQLWVENSFRKFRQNGPTGNFLKFQATDWIVQSVFPAPRLPLLAIDLAAIQKAVCREMVTLSLYIMFINV